MTHTMARFLACWAIFCSALPFLLASMLPGTNITEHVGLSCTTFKACGKTHRLLMQMDIQHTVLTTPAKISEVPKTLENALYMVNHLQHFMHRLVHISKIHPDDSHVVFLDGKLSTWNTDILSLIARPVKLGHSNLLDDIHLIQQARPYHDAPCKCAKVDLGEFHLHQVASIVGRAADVYKFSNMTYTCLYKTEKDNTRSSSAFLGTRLCECFCISRTACADCSMLSMQDVRGMMVAKSPGDTIHPRLNPRQLGQRYMMLGDDIHAVWLYKDQVTGSMDHSSNCWPVGSQSMAENGRPASNVKYIFGVMGMFKDYAWRQSIRSTYMQYPNVFNHIYNPHGTVQVMFVTGRIPYGDMDHLLLEYMRYQDMIVLDVHENMNEGKTIWWYTWAWTFAKNSNIKAVGKVDMDSFVRTAIFERQADKLIDKYGGNNLYWGKMHCRHHSAAAQVHVNVGHNGLVCYANGRMQVLGMGLVKHLATDQTPMLHPYNTKLTARWEDFWVGVLLHNSTKVIIPWHEAADVSMRVADAPEQTQDLRPDAILVHRVKNHLDFYLYWNYFQPV